MNERETILAGRIGFFLSIFLWLLCTWRLGFHSCWKRIQWDDRDDVAAWQNRSQSRTPVIQHGSEQQREQRHSFPCSLIQWITRRRAFHAFLWMAAFCELISYADLSGMLPFTSDRLLAGNIGYVLLNVIGRTFELVAFCIVTEIWLQTAIDARPRSMDSGSTNQSFWLRWLPSIFVLFAALLVTVSVSLSVVLFCRFPRPPNREYVLAMPLSVLQSILEAICWGLLALMVALSMEMTSKCILILVPSTQWKRRLSLFNKAVGPMLISCFAYTGRSIWLALVCFDRDRRDSWAWWISFTWGPTVIVSVMLLYSTRKRDSVVEEVVSIENNVTSSIDDDEATHSLQRSLLRPQPPEEAFRAFHRFRHGEDEMNDSFSLSSPTPRRNILDTEMEDQELHSSVDNAHSGIDNEANDSEV